MAEPVSAKATNRPPEANPHHVLVPSNITDDRIRIFKHGDTFAVFDHVGQIRPGGLGEEGLYHFGTRYLSRLILELDGQPPFFLGSTIRDANDQLLVSLTNPDRIRGQQIELPLGTLHLAVRMLIWQGACHWRLRASNHGFNNVDMRICLFFGADFADIFEVRGMKRQRRGSDLPPEIAPGGVTLEYRGLDGQTRMTSLRFRPAPVELAADRACFELQLLSKHEAAIDLMVSCSRGETFPELLGFDDAEASAAAALMRLKTGSCRINAAESRFDTWIRRSESDLHMLTTELPTGPYPYAGIPWFNTPFGRDGIITALQCLAFWPDLARGVLGYLANTQATGVIPSQDA
jgi:glycogen debranching enzyme